MVMLETNTQTTQPEVEAANGRFFDPRDPHVSTELFWKQHQDIIGEQGCLVVMTGIHEDGAWVEIGPDIAGVLTLFLDVSQRQKGVYTWQIDYADRASREVTMRSVSVAALDTSAEARVYDSQLSLKRQGLIPSEGVLEDIARILGNPNSVQHLQEVQNKRVASNGHRVTLGQLLRFNP